MLTRLAHVLRAEVVGLTVTKEAAGLVVEDSEDTSKAGAAISGTGNNNQSNNRRREKISNDLSHLTNHLGF